MSFEEDDEDYMDDKIFRLQEIRRQYRLNVLKEQDQRRAVVKGLANLYIDLDGRDLVKASYDVVLMDKKDIMKVGDKEIKVADLQFMLAESIELICSGTNSVQEYFNWFGECADIMSHMNDGFISDMDLDERNAWVGYSYTREAELLTCLALYKSSSYSAAEQKYDFLYNKLVKLRQMRSAILETTVGTADEQREKNEESEKKAMPVYMDSMSKFGSKSTMWNMPVNELFELGMYHGDDYDLVGEYKYFYGKYEPVPELEEHREKYAFEKDLKKNFAANMTQKHFEELSASEELIENCEQEEEKKEDKKIVNRRIHRLRKYYVPRHKKNKKFFDAKRYRDLF